MAVDSSPLSLLQARVALPLDPSPLSKTVAHYLISCKVDGRSLLTIDNYARRLGKFLVFARAHEFPSSISEITSHHIRLFILHLQELKLATATIHLYYRVLHTFFDWLVAERIIEHSPMGNIRAPRLNFKVPLPFTSGDIGNLLTLCSGNRFIHIRNRAIVLTFMDTGIRLDEMAHIQLADMDFSRETIKIHGKNAKERYVRMGKATQKAILRYLLLRNDGLPCLWLTEERRTMQRAGIKIMVQRLCRAAQVTDARPGPHTFRHTAALSFLRNGGGEFTLQLMLGHSTLSTTRRYVATLGAEDVIKAHQKASPVDNMKL